RCDDDREQRQVRCKRFGTPPTVRPRKQSSSRMDSDDARNVAIVRSISDPDEIAAYAAQAFAEELRGDSLAMAVLDDDAPPEGFNDTDVALCCAHARSRASCCKREIRTSAGG